MTGGVYRDEIAGMHRDSGCTQCWGLIPGLQHARRGLYQLSHILSLKLIFFLGGRKENCHKLTNCLMEIQIPMIWAQSIVGITPDDLSSRDPVVNPGQAGTVLSYTWVGRLAAFWIYRILVEQWGFCNNLWVNTWQGSHPLLHLEGTMVGTLNKMADSLGNGPAWAVLNNVSHFEVGRVKRQTKPRLVLFIINVWCLPTSRLVIELGMQIAWSCLD